MRRVRSRTPFPALRLLGWLLGTAASQAAAPSFDPRAGLPVIRNFPPEVYQAHSQIFATAQLPNGTMCFATYGMVVTYDGERWQRHPTSGTWVRTLTVGPDGLLYIGGVDTLGRLEPAADTGLLHFVSLADTLPAAQRNFGTVWSSAGVDGRICFAIDGAVLSWRDGAFRVQEFPKQRPALRTAGTEVFCHLGDQVLRWQAGEWRPWLQDARFAAARRVVLLPAEPGAFLVVLDTGLVLHAKLTEKTPTPWATAAAEFLDSAGIRNALQLADGSYAFSTAGEGVVFIATDGTPLRRLTGATGLVHTTTYGLANGSAGTMWVETANGVSQVDPQRRWSIFDSRNGRPDAIGGEPMIFGQKIALSISDTPPLQIRPAPDGLDIARAEIISPLLPARISNFQAAREHLYGGGERGLWRLDGTPRMVYQSPSQTENISAVTGAEDLMVIGMLHGIEIVRLHADDTASLVAKVPGFDAEITAIDETAPGEFWAGTTAGIAVRFRLDPTGRVTDSKIFDATSGLPAGAGWVRVMETPQGPLCVVRQGVFQLSMEERWVPHPAFANYQPASINNLPVTTDRAGRFWFQVARGPDRFEAGCLDLRGASPVWTPLDPEINEVLGFGGIRIVTYLREERGEFLWLAGTRSTVRLSLESAVPNIPAPAAVITEAGQGARRWAPREPAPRLAFSREPLRILFSSPPTVGTRVRYETRLVGYDATWTPASSAEATFTNLVGGPFTFEVRAKDSLDRVGPPARYTFSVAPPWHRTPLAYSLYGFAALSGIAGFMRWRLGRAERERRRLEALVATRTAELATARDQAETANRAKSAFLASMSHELRTPLNGVIGYAQVLQGDARLLPDQQERVRIVHQSGEHLLRMINDVLDLAKIEAGKLELRVAPFALRDLLRDLAAVHGPAAAARQLAFTVLPADDLPAWVEGDAQKTRQVLDNLLGNALKFTARGSVTLRVTVAGRGRLAFAVSDTGAGISAADQARLFQPFEQAKATRTNAPGTGLGLAISRALVERMGGELTLASEVGKGSTFAFTLPLPEAEPLFATVPEPARVVGYAGPRRRVMIVDDHPVNRGLLRDLLVPLGFTCGAHESAANALSALAAGSEPWPDLAILDVRMEGMDGLDLTRKLRAVAHDRPLRILLMSASVLTFNVADGRAAGCDDFLAKPFRTADLLEKIGALLGLEWRDGTSHAPFPPGASEGGLPAAARESLRELLAQGDLEAFRQALARLRIEHPAAEARWQALDEAAAGYQLSRLRHLLESA